MWRRKPTDKRRPGWRVSALLLAAAGISVCAIGIYFIALRPPLLAEDVRYAGLSQEALQMLGPAFPTWLLRVFTVLGGFALSTGLLTVFLAATAFRQRQPLAFVAAAAAGVSSVGLMATINFVIGSDYKWLLAAVAVVWLASLVAFVYEAR